MIKLIPFKFNEHIEFVLDCIEDATPSSWPGLIRTEKMRKIDYEFFKGINTDENIIKILIDEEKSIGFLWCDIKYNKIEDKKYCHGDFIYVLPEYRGKGCGKYLMSNLENIARDNDAFAVTLEVTISNTPAVHLYGSEGFAKTRYIMKKII